MKKLFSTITASALALTLLSLTAPAASAAPINGMDTNLQACINETFNRPAETTVTSEEITSLTGDLNCSDRGITSLSGLENATNLISLNLNRNNITEVPELSALTNLYELYLSDNKLTEVSDLSGIAADLFVLDISNNQVYNISPLSEIGQNITNDDFIGSQFVSSPTLRAGGQTISTVTTFGNPYMFDFPRGQGDFSFSTSTPATSWNGEPQSGVVSEVPDYIQENDGVTLNSNTGEVTVLNLGDGGKAVTVVSSISNEATESGNSIFPYEENANLTAFGEPLRSIVIFDTTSIYELPDYQYLWNEGVTNQLFTVEVAPNSMISKQASVFRTATGESQTCLNPVVTSVIYNGVTPVEDFDSFVYVEGDSIVFDSTNGLEPIYPIFGGDSYYVQVECYDVYGNASLITAEPQFAFDEVVPPVEPPIDPTDPTEPPVVEPPVVTPPVVTPPVTEPPVVVTPPVVEPTPVPVDDPKQPSTTDIIKNGGENEVLLYVLGGLGILLLVGGAATFIVRRKTT